MILRFHAIAKTNYEQKQLSERNVSLLSVLMHLGYLLVIFSIFSNDKIMHKKTIIKSFAFVSHYMQIFFEILTILRTRSKSNLLTGNPDLIFLTTIIKIQFRRIVEKTTHRTFIDAKIIAKVV